MQIGKMAYGDVKVTHYMTLDDFMEFVGVTSLHVCILKMFCPMFKKIYFNGNICINCYIAKNNYQELGLTIIKCPH